MRLWKKFLIVVLVILAIQAYIFVRSSDPMFLDRSNPLTIEEVIALHEKSENITNIHMVYKEPASWEKIWKIWFPTKRMQASINNGAQISYSIGTREIFVKDNKILTISKYKAREGSGELFDDVTHIWEDINSKEKITIFVNSETIFHVKNTEIYTSWRAHFFDTEYNEEYHEYMYLGRTKVNKRDTVVIKLYDTNSYRTTIYYIDEETGIIVKELHRKSPDTLMYTTRKSLKFELNTVTGEEVKKIDYKTIYPDFRVTEIDYEA